MQKSVRQVKLFYTLSQLSQSISKPTLDGLALIIGENSIQTILSPSVVLLVGETDKMDDVSEDGLTGTELGNASAWNNSSG